MYVTFIIFYKDCDVSTLHSAHNSTKNIQLSIKPALKDRHREINERLVKIPVIHGSNSGLIY